MQKLGGSGRRHGVAARSRDVEMIGVLTSPAIDAVGSTKGHMRLAGGLSQRCSHYDDVSSGTTSVLKITSEKT